MTQERNFGVVEARVGLSLLTCLLVALGYVVLQRLGESGASAVVELPATEVAPMADVPSSNGRGEWEQPQLLTAQDGESTAPFDTAARQYDGRPIESGSAVDPPELSIGELRRASYPSEAGTPR